METSSKPSVSSENSFVSSPKQEGDNSGSSELNSCFLCGFWKNCFGKRTRNPSSMQAEVLKVATGKSDPIKDPGPSIKRVDADWVRNPLQRKIDLERERNQLLLIAARSNNQELFFRTLGRNKLSLYLRNAVINENATDICKGGDFDIIRTVLKMGFIGLYTWRAALQVAAHFNRLRIIQLFLRHFPLPLEESSENEMSQAINDSLGMAVCMAAAQGHRRAIRMLLKHGSLSIGYRTQAFYQAVIKKHFSTVNQLLDTGPICTEMILPTLKEAEEKGAHEIVRLLNLFVEREESELFEV